MLELSSQSRLLGTNPIVWLRDQEPVETFQKGPPPEKAKLKRWWTYLSQFRQTVHHIQGINNEMGDYISRNNFNVLLGESSEALGREAFQGMDVQLDLSMPTAGVQGGWCLRDHHAVYKCVLNSLSDGLEARLIDGNHWYRDAIEIDFCPLILNSESLKKHWSTTPRANQSDNYPECLRSLNSIEIPCIK